MHVEQSAMGNNIVGDKREYDCHLCRMAGENAAEVAALRGWKVYFNTLTIPGRRNVSLL